MIATHTAAPTSAVKDLDRSLAFYHSVFGAFRKKVPQGGEIVLRRYDPLVPGEIGDRFWDTGDPRLYIQRLPVDYVHLSSVAMEATGVSDFNGYFQKRKEWLQLEITDTLDPVEREALQVRLRVLDAASQTSDPSASPA